MSLSGSWDLEIDSSVFKALKKFPRRDAEVILRAIRLLPLDPYFGDIQKMKGTENTWRRRIGNYRVFYRVIVTSYIVKFRNTKSDEVVGFYIIPGMDLKSKFDIEIETYRLRPISEAILKELLQIR